MTYHPDHYKGEDGALKFREVTEAYEVLGNIKKRRLYDRGLYNFGMAASPKEAEDYASQLRKSGRPGDKKPTKTGRTAVFDFDSWSKEHYTSTFQETQKIKRKAQYEEEQQKKDKDDKRSEFFVFVLLVSLFFGLVPYFK